MTQRLCPSKCSSLPQIFPAAANRGGGVLQRGAEQLLATSQLIQQGSRRIPFPPWFCFIVYSAYFSLKKNHAFPNCVLVDPNVPWRFIKGFVMRRSKTVYKTSRKVACPPLLIFPWKVQPQKDSVLVLGHTFRSYKTTVKSNSTT